MMARATGESPNNRHHDRFRSVHCKYASGRRVMEIDLPVLETIVAESYRNLTSGGYGLRARESAGPAGDDPIG